MATNTRAEKSRGEQTGAISSTMVVFSMAAKVVSSLFICPFSFACNLLATRQTSFTAVRCAGLHGKVLVVCSFIFSHRSPTERPRALDDLIPVQNF